MSRRSIRATTRPFSYADLSQSGDCSIGNRDPASLAAMAGWRQALGSGFVDRGSGVRRCVRTIRSTSVGLANAWRIVSTIAIIGGGIWLYKQAKTSVSAPYEELHAKLEQGAELHCAALVLAKDRCAIESQRILTHRDQELNSAQAKFEQKIAESTSARDAAVETAKQRYARPKQELITNRDAALADATPRFRQTASHSAALSAGSSRSPSTSRKGWRECSPAAR